MSEANEQNLSMDEASAELSIEEMEKVSGGITRTPRTRDRGISEAEGGSHGLEYKGLPDRRFFRPANFNE